MKKIFYLLLMPVIIFTFLGCESAYGVSGLENFSENACSFGLNDGLLPGNREFLTDYLYEEGDYHYWTDGSYSKAKTFVMLQYSEPIYQKVKSLCENYYSFSPVQFNCGDFAFSEPHDVYESSEYDFSGLQMFGYNDDTCTLIFIGCVGYAFNQYETINVSIFTEFFIDEFGAYLTT